MVVTKWSVKRLYTPSRKACNKSRMAKSFLKICASVVEGEHEARPHDDESNRFYFPRTQTSTVIWIDLQWLEDPLWFSLLSSNSNTFWACKVAQLSWTAESMLFLKKPLTAKTKGINIVTHISYAAEDFKAHLDKTGHKSATPPLMRLGGDSHLLGKWNKCCLSSSHGRLWNMLGYAYIWNLRKKKKRSWRT